jgi:sterol desaturase/sphingolipid hydroxylase (fatty acid hydroxylase superfamily)
VTRALDHAFVPAFLACAIAATYALFELGVPDWLLTGLVVGPLAVAAAVLERVYPERAEYRRLDQPLAVDAAHFLFNYQFGYVLALAAGGALDLFVRRHVGVRVWPERWPLAVQIAFAVFVAEGVSYWQHRWAHRTRWLWRFHALHHYGERLNVVRAGRFHFVDIGLGAFFVIAPLVALGAPTAILTWVATLSGALGILEHANIRMRTSSWLDRVICTPAVHRHHHSRVPEESNRNFGTTFMVFDLLFGTYGLPRQDGPLAMGIENADATFPRGFWNQVIAPFRGD